MILLRIKKYFSWGYITFRIRHGIGKRASPRFIRWCLRQIGYWTMCLSERSVWDYDPAVQHIMLALVYLQDLDSSQKEAVEEVEKI